MGDRKPEFIGNKQTISFNYSITHIHTLNFIYLYRFIAKAICKILWKFINNFDAKAKKKQSTSFRTRGIRPIPRPARPTRLEETYRLWGGGE